MRKLARVGRDVDDRPGPGFVILQVDGLAEPVIKTRASHRPDALPGRLAPRRQPQAGPLRGARPVHDRLPARRASCTATTRDIPAFRWWERDRDYLMVSNHPDDAFLIEQRASGPERPAARRRREHLQPGVRAAPRAPSRPIASCRAAGRGCGWTAFSLYLLNPYNVTRGVRHVHLEPWHSSTSRRASSGTRDVRPRIAREMPFPFLRAATTTVLRDMTDGPAHRRDVPRHADRLRRLSSATTRWPTTPGRSATESLRRSCSERRPEVRHASARRRDGPAHATTSSSSPTTARARAPRSAERYGQTLEEVVARARWRGDAARRSPPPSDAESLGAGQRVLTEPCASPAWPAAWPAAACARTRSTGSVELGPRAVEGGTWSEMRAPRPDRGVRPNSWSPRRATWPTSTSRASPPRGTPGGDRGSCTRGCLRAWCTPGDRVRAGAQRRAGGAWPSGARGCTYLDDDRVSATTPSPSSGRTVADNLRRLDSFANVGRPAGQLLLRPATEEDRALRAPGGGARRLGGAQTKAFVLYRRGAGAIATTRCRSSARRRSTSKIREWMARARELDAAPAGMARTGARLSPEVAEVLHHDQTGGGPAAS